MAFFDFLTQNSNDKRNAKNLAKSEQQKQIDQSNQAFGAAMPWLTEAHTQAQGLFNPDTPAHKQQEAGAAGQKESYGQQVNALNSQHTGLEGIAANPGYTAGEAQNLKLAATAPVAGAWGSAAGQVANHASLTGNSAGLAPSEASFARQKARDITTAGYGAAKDIADARIHGTEYATSGFGNEATGRGAAAQTAANMNAGGLDAEASQRANIAASLAPAQLAAGLYGTAQGGANQATGQQFSWATQPSFLRQAALAGIGATSDTLTKAALGG